MTSHEYSSWLNDCALQECRYGLMNGKLNQETTSISPSNEGWMPRGCFCYFSRLRLWDQVGWHWNGAPFCFVTQRTKVGVLFQFFLPTAIFQTLLAAINISIRSEEHTSELQSPDH